MIRKKSEDSFYREATVLKSVNYLKHSGKFIILFKFFVENKHQSDNNQMV